MTEEKIQFELLHIGINRFGEEDNRKTAMLLAELFGFTFRETPGSYFVNEQIEVCNKSIGTHGHFAFGTQDVEKAVAYLEGRGIEFDRENARRDESGRIRLIFAKEEIAGFAFHLSLKPAEKKD